MDYLKIRNWDKWQSYRADRGQPPWIKVHRRLMRDIEWVSLSDAERGQLISIWLLAADRDGEIPNDARVIQKLCHMDTPPNINKFIDLEFILPFDVIVASERRQHDCPEAKAKAETEKTRAKSNGFDKFWEAYPKKKSKGQAEKTWAKLKPSSELLDKMLIAIANLKRSSSWVKDGGQFIPYPSTWLNSKGWEDEIEIEQVKDNNYYKTWETPAWMKDLPSIGKKI